MPRAVGAPGAPGTQEAPASAGPSVSTAAGPPSPAQAREPAGPSASVSAGARARIRPEADGGRGEGRAGNRGSHRGRRAAPARPGPRTRRAVGIHGRRARRARRDTRRGPRRAARYLLPQPQEALRPPEAPASADPPGRGCRDGPARVPAGRRRPAPRRRRRGRARLRAQRRARDELVRLGPGRAAPHTGPSSASTGPATALSAAARTAPTAAGEAHRIAGVLDAPRLTGAPVTVVGHSIAGFHAEAFARLHPRPHRRARPRRRLRGESTPARPPHAAARTALARALGAALATAGAPAALGPAARRTAVRLSRARRAPDPAPAALVRRCYATRRVWKAPCWRAPTTRPSPPDCWRCAPATRCGPHCPSPSSRRPAPRTAPTGGRHASAPWRSSSAAASPPYRTRGTSHHAGPPRRGGRGGPHDSMTGGALRTCRTPPARTRRPSRPAVPGQVGLADDADETLVLDDRQALDLVALHLAQHVADVGARVDPPRCALRDVCR